MTNSPDVKIVVAGSQVTAPFFTAHLASLYDKIATAVRNRDGDSFAELYAPDAALMTPDGAVIQGTESIRDAFFRLIDAGWVGQRAELVGLVLSDGLVVEEGRSQGTFEVGGATSVLRNNYLATHIRTADGEWLMHRDIWNAIPDVPSAGMY
ncbi:MAG TPA: nuclear transport factor 2 family protein [Mycobacterium sp.]